MTSGLRHLALLLQGLCLVSSVQGGNIQLSGLSLPSDAGTNKALVQSVFLDAYNAYRKYAWTHDDLAPISAGYRDPRNGWGASAFDALGTLKIMGQTVSAPVLVQCVQGGGPDIHSFPGSVQRSCLLGQTN
jgi:hypothetical protein